MNTRFVSIFGPVATIFILTLAGCSTPETPQVASADRPAEAPSTGVPTSAPVKESDYEKALRYTRCMTENGVTIPDPVEGKALPISNVEAKPGTWEVLDLGAFNKCKHFLPATWPVKWDPEYIARFRPFNECMRKLGMDVLEPDANGMVHDRTDPTAPQSAEYRAAEDKCRYLIPE